MLGRIRNLFGMQPPLTGLENLLEEVKSGSLTVTKAAGQIRDLAAQPYLPPGFIRMLRFQGAVFAMVSIIMAIYSVYFTIGTTETIGTVIEMNGTIQQVPVIEYYANGQRFTFRSSIWSDPSPYATGDKIRIIYDPDHPDTAQINTFHDRWMFPLVFSLAGLCAVGFSFALPRIFAAMK